MEKQNAVQCDVISDLMVLYSLGKASEETSLLVESHLPECQACAKAFRHEPQVRKQLDLSEIIPVGMNVDGFVEGVKYIFWSVIEWLFFGFSGLVRLLDKALHKFGLSTIALKIKIYRARRRIAGVLLNEQPADAQALANG